MNPLQIVELILQITQAVAAILAEHPELAPKIQGIVKTTADANAAGRPPIVP